MEVEPFPLDQLSDLKIGWLGRCLNPPKSAFFPEEMQAVYRIACRGASSKTLRDQIYAELFQEKSVRSPIKVLSASFSGLLSKDSCASALGRMVSNSLWMPLNPVWDALNHNQPLTSEHAELILRFLEVNPYVFRSGYIKMQLIRKLYQAEPTANQAQRVEVLLRSQIFDRMPRSMTGWPKLARLLPDETVIQIIREARKHEDQLVRNRAEYIIGWKGVSVNI